MVACSVYLYTAILGANVLNCRVEVRRVLVLQSAQRKSLAPILAVHLLRFDGSPPRRGRSRSVIGSQMAGARRAADLVGQQPYATCHAARTDRCVMHRRQGRDAVRAMDRYRTVAGRGRRSNAVHGLSVGLTRRCASGPAGRGAGSSGKRTWAPAGGRWPAVCGISKSRPRPKEIHGLLWPADGVRHWMEHYRGQCCNGASGRRCGRFPVTARSPRRPAPELDVMRALVVAERSGKVRRIRRLPD